jgi:pyruvate phosphate dikinase (EC 2.7.9.1)
MPGMMDTILNLGLNDETVKGLSNLGGERFAYDAYRRFIQMFGDVVLKVDKENFERELEELKREKSKQKDTDLTADDLKELVERFKRVLREHGKEIPEGSL